MKLWIAVVHDRHIDPEASAHLSREAAIANARSYMAEHVAEPAGLRETDDGERWSMWYEYESDNAFVVGTQINLGDKA